MNLYLVETRTFALLFESLSFTVFTGNSMVFSGI